MAERGTSGLTIGAAASAAAAVMHAAAAGIHADDTGLARVFIGLAVAQLIVAVVAFTRRSGRLAWTTLLGVNLVAVAGWLATRTVGIAAIDGLAVAEGPHVADTVAAALAVIAVAAAASCAFERPDVLPRRGVAGMVALSCVLLVPGLAAATSHDHDHGSDASGHDHATETADAAGAAADTDHTDHDHTGDEQDGATGDTVDAAGAAATDHDHDHTTDTEQADGTDHDHTGDEPGGATTATWPRPWDPAEPIDFSGVPGVTPEQQARAEQLARDTVRELPAFADVGSLAALGYHSIGDAATGFEHYINLGLFDDGKELDPTAPESLVYRVDGQDRTLVSAMFIVARTAIDDPKLTGFAGPLMQWHVHDNLCWGLDDAGEPVVKGVLAAPGDACPPGSVNAGADNPMVHVWIVPHECGPFAALDGQGAGQTSADDGERTDQCSHGHDGHDGHDDGAAETATVAYDPELPIDLGGVPGVTLQQQAFAENLVAATVRDLPQWADLDAVETAGFHSIGDGATGHEHYIQWDWIDDDVWLDPDHPESLVFEPQPDGSKRLVSAMYMLPGGTALEDVPDWGGALMQWHVHGDLCFTDDPVAPTVAGTKPLGTSCRPPLVDGPLAPMIHVWIIPHECGPFAALDGIAGGQVPDGEAVMCDHAHGAH